MPGVAHVCTCVCTWVLMYAHTSASVLMHAWVHQETHVYVMLVSAHVGAQVHTCACTHA